MTDTFDASQSLAPADLEIDLAEAGSALTQFVAGPVAQTSAAIENAFDRTGKHITEALKSAARTGEVEFRDMVGSILAELAGLATEHILSGINPSFFGARADGGPVVPGGAYLVGERGPELVQPASAGQVSAGSAGVSVTVNVAAGGSARDIIESQGQIAAALNRAVRAGSRFS